MIEISEIPRSSYDLIDLLDRAYPHRCIGQHESEKDARHRAGVRQLVDQLLNMKQEELDEAEEEGEKTLDDHKVLR